MESGFRTPLLDFFRRGDVARDVKLLAAQGVLAPRAHEQLGLLVLLVKDPDQEIAAAAEQTIQAIPPASLSAFLGRPDVGSELRTFFQERGIEPAGGVANESDVPFVDTAAAPAPAPADEDEKTTTQRIAGLGVPQKVALAMKGSREERAILIRDPNKMVAVAVLSSPKLTETEVESIAKMASVSDEILRMIGNTRAWIKNYQVVAALTRNPKTPVAISMNLMARLSDRELRTLSTDRNIPEVLRLTARKKLVAS